MDLHLLSVPGDRDIRYVIEACKPYLADKDEATLAFMPLASLNIKYWLDYTIRAFGRLAKVELVDTEQMTLPEMESILRRAQVAYISGGNTFLLNHRLHVSRLMPYLRKKIQAGLPVVGFSAGAILCGPNILTSKDLNSVATPHFEALNVTPFNFFVHYDEAWSAIYDDWLSDYHVFNENPVIIMADNAYVKVEGKKIALVRGDAWLLRKGEEKQKLDLGAKITL